MRTSGYRLGAVILIGLGLVLPPVVVAGALRPDDPGLLVTGWWVFKAIAVATGLGLLGLDRWGRTGPVTPLPPLERWERIGLGAILLVAVALRMRGLGAGLWYDEIQTLVEYLRLPFLRMITTFDSTNQHLLYSVLASGPVAILGETAVAVRLPAAVLGVASLAAVVAFGRRVGMGRESLLVAGFMAASYHHVWFSQNARGYTGLMLWTLLASALLLDLLRGRGTKIRVLGYAVVTALAVYTHLTALFTVLVHGLLWLLTWRSTDRQSRWDTGAALVFAGLVTALLYSPIAPQVVTVLTTPSAEPVTPSWKEPLWMLREALGGLASGLPGGLVTLAGGLLIGVAGLVSTWRRDRVATGLMVLPVIVTALVILGTKHNLWPRFFFFAAGFAGLLAIGGGLALLGLVAGHRTLPLTAGIVGLASLGSLATLPRAWRPKQDYRAAAEFVEGRAGPGDAIAVSDLTETPYQLWMAKPWPSVAEPADLARLEAASPTTWVLTTFANRHAAVHPALADRLRVAYDTAAIFPGTVGGGSVIVFRSRKVPPAD